MKLFDVHFTVLDSRQRHRVIQQRKEHVAQLLYSQHARLVQVLTSVVCCLHFKLEWVTLRKVAITYHRFFTLLFYHVLETYILINDIVNLSLQILDLSLQLLVLLFPLIFFAINSRIKSLDFLEQIVSEMRSRFLLGFARTELGDSPRVLLQIEWKPGDHRWHIVELIGVVSEHLVRQWLRYLLRFPLFDKSLLTFPFVHHV